MKKVDLIGQRFGSLTVIARAENKVWTSSSFQAQWLCKCECGNEVLFVSARLLSEGRTSCGCMNYQLDKHGNVKYDNPKDVSFNSLIRRYKNICKRDGKEWKLTREQAINIFEGKCYYCGIEPQNVYNVYIQKNGTTVTQNAIRAVQAEVLVNGIDRIDSNLGYIYSNVVSCCTTCNFAKNTLNIKDFYSWLDRIAKFQGYSK